MPADRVLEGALSLVTFFGQAKKVTRPPGRRTKPHTDVNRFSRSAPRTKAKSKWIPAFAGMTAKGTTAQEKDHEAKTQKGAGLPTDAPKTPKKENLNPSSESALR